MSRKNACWLLVVTALVVGCGGGDDDGDPGSGAGLTRAQLVERVNAICAQAGKELVQVRVPSAPAEVADYLNRLIPISENAMSDVRKLRPDGEAKKDFDAMVDKQAKALDALKKLADEAESGTPDANLISRLAPAGTEYREATKKLGASC